MPESNRASVDTFKGIELPFTQGSPGGSDSKESACNVGDPSSIPGWEDPLEKGMATHSKILAWRIPWTEEPGGLQSMWCLYGVSNKTKKNFKMKLIRSIDTKSN